MHSAPGMSFNSLTVSARKAPSIRNCARVEAVFGTGPRGEWLPYLLLWSGVFIGASIGAFAHSRMGLTALILPVAVLMLMAAVSLQAGLSWDKSVPA